MAREETNQWCCRDCGHISLEVDLLRAPNPFSVGENIVGCPKCKGVGNFARLCDEPGCCNEATCGFPTTEGDEFGGYRMTCHEHSKYAVRLTGVEGFA